MQSLSYELSDADRTCSEIFAHWRSASCKVSALCGLERGRRSTAGGGARQLGDDRHADALKLLGREREFKHDIVRRFAVAALERASDEELIDYLLQLVQALRYEGGADTASSVATDAAEEAAQAGGELVAVAHSHLSRFLVSRAMQSFELANYPVLVLEGRVIHRPEGQTTAYPIYRRVSAL